MPRKKNPKAISLISSAVANHQSASGKSMSAVQPLQQMSGDSQDKEDEHSLNDAPVKDVKSFQLKPGREKHLPHEAWHVVQQRQGRAPVNKSSVVQRVLLYKGKHINTMKELAGDKDAWGAYRALNDPDKEKKLKDALNIFDLEKNLAPVGRSGGTPTDVATTQPEIPVALGEGTGRTSHSGEVSTPASHGPQLQGAFVLDALGKIKQTSNDNAYYKGIGYAAVPASDGRIIWCTPLKVDKVKSELAAAGLTVLLPDDVEMIRNTGVNIEQDGHREGNAPDQQYYYIGKGIAWTTRIRTCTALTIYDTITGNSFLCHADGGEGNLDRIIQNLKQYLEVVNYEPGGQTLVIKVYTADDTERNEGESYVVVREGLTTFKLPPPNIIHVNPADTVAVSVGGPAQHLLSPEDKLENAVRKYENNESDTNLENIMSILQRYPAAVTEEISYRLYLIYRCLEGNEKQQRLAPFVKNHL